MNKYIYHIQNYHSKYPIIYEVYANSTNKAAEILTKELQKSWEQIQNNITTTIIIKNVMPDF
jgi:hypothetical protein